MGDRIKCIPAQKPFPIIVDAYDNIIAAKFKMPVPMRAKFIFTTCFEILLLSIYFKILVNIT